MKCFERLVLSHMNSVIPSVLGKHQFAYRTDHSTKVSHLTLTHLETPSTEVRVLFVDFSFAFNMVIPHKLVSKLHTLGVRSSLCAWVIDFLMDWPQQVRVGKNISYILAVTTGTPQGCVLSPVLFTLFTHDCTSIRYSSTIIDFADDTTIVGLISGNDETAYRHEVDHPTWCCGENDLVLQNQNRITLLNQLTWTDNISQLVKKAQH